MILPPRTLLFNKFGINIIEYCSGIESIALFTGLYALIGVLDWQRFNHKRVIYIFPIGLIILFLFNILRVFVLILGGYYINPSIAFSLFHTYAGMVFFILYSIIFWAVSYKSLLLDSNKVIFKK
jgi:exosortase/archaeosortase family protein